MAARSSMSVKASSKQHSSFTPLSRLWRKRACSHSFRTCSSESDRPHRSWESLSRQLLGAGMSKHFLGIFADGRSMVLSAPTLDTSNSSASMPSHTFIVPSLPVASLAGPSPWSTKRGEASASVAHAAPCSLLALAVSDGQVGILRF